MKRILVPTDFSTTSEKAFRFALELAQKAKGTVILYHAYTPVENSFVGTEKTRELYNTQSEIDVAKRLQRLSKKIAADTPGVPVSTIVGRSPIIDNILGFAEHNHIDLIVMGTQGASGLKMVIIGSVAARVVEESDTPVLLVPEKYEPQAIEHFVFAADYRSPVKHGLELTNNLAKLYDAEVTVLHYLSAYTTEPEKGKEKSDFDSYARSMQEQFKGSKINFHLMEVSSVDETMETLDRKVPYDVMVMVRRRKSFLEKFFVKSFTQKMAYATQKPLLVVPEEEIIKEKNKDS